MLSTLKNHLRRAIHTAILKHRRYCKSFPHPVWVEHGYPTKKGDGWIGDPRTWELDVGRLSQALYFYQDPGTKPVERHWPSIDLGTEIYISCDQVAEWIVSDFDIVVPKLRTKLE
ncbi:hypothetical protein OIU85_002363 [Salix viminalis]|uniref:DUF7705 domain-containing protein n=1 Tax=Salix viminalis TaxID=40686 RepID=A0A9Q0VP07_SALVM|nr:hypothetical protein OIU85_002363 [Salix viminalis]